MVADGRLRGQRVARRRVGRAAEDVEIGVRDAVERGGRRGRLVSACRRRSRPRCSTAPGGRWRAADRRRRRRPRRSAAAAARGRRGRARAQARARRPTFSGELRGRRRGRRSTATRRPTPDDDEAARELELREAFEDGLLEGLRDNVVGVEAIDTDPSQIGCYERPGHRERGRRRHARRPARARAGARRRRRSAQGHRPSAPEGELRIQGHARTGRCLICPD